MTQTLDQIRREGLAALRAKLGRAGMIRFLAQFESAKGDLHKAAVTRTTRVAASREPFRKIRKRVLDTMMSYMKASEYPGYGYACGYQLKHIDRCAAIIDAYHAEISAKAKRTPDQIMKAVERAVLKLNKLNAACNGALIETDQREDLCQLIFVAARSAGLKVSEDITEPWRQW